MDDRGEEILGRLERESGGRGPARRDGGESPIRLMAEFGMNAVQRATEPRRGERRSLLRRQRKQRRQDDELF